MTDPVDRAAPLVRRNYGNNHGYTIGNQKVPGVTTLGNEGWPKPGLVYWAANETRDAAIDRWDELAELPVSARYKELTYVHNKVRDKAAARGTKVHTLAESLIQGDQVEVPEDLRGHVDAYVRWLDRHGFEAVLVEAPVANRTLWYAGTLDVIGTFPRIRPEWGTCLADIKTSRKRPRGETALQLSAYRYAEVYLDQHGVEHAMADLQVERAFVIWVREDGVDLIPVDTDAVQLQAFRMAAWIARTREETDDLATWVGDAVVLPDITTEGDTDQ